MRITLSRSTSSTLLRGLLVLVLACAAAIAAPPLAQADSSRHPVDAPLTNLAHLNFLGDQVSPPSQAGHTTYRLEEQPTVGVLWVYADRQDDGTYRRVGGGAYDPATNTYGQGAYDADDIARAAVVYVRHWRQFGDEQSRDRAYQLLRGLMYLQDATGPDAGNVVLWMQPDGRLNPTPTPADSPNPSDSGPSYWLARTIWALGEGYAAFQGHDADFANYLRARLTLAMGALERQVLSRYGDYVSVDGVRRPAWLITDGADASSEACLGLAAYVAATGDPRARSDLRQLARGIALMSSGGGDRWPYGAIEPWVPSLSEWHAWGDQMSGALARTSVVLRDRGLLAPAVKEAAQFTPHLLVGGGPDNGWTPAPDDRTQIAYGADATLQNLLAVADATGRASFRKLAGFAASWYFGNNAAHTAMYDPRTGVTYDGVSADGTVNLNSGAESTIHGLLSMLALDAHPGVARAAMVSARASQHSWTLVQAESGTLSGAARVVTPPSAWTGEGLWSGGSYVALGSGGRVRAVADLSSAGRYLVEPIFNRLQGRPHVTGTRQRLGGSPAGVVFQGGAGAPGVSAVPGYLTIAPSGVTRRLSAGSHRLVSAHVGGAREAQLDGWLVQPLVEQLVLRGSGHSRALLRSFAHRPRTSVLRLPSGSGRVHLFEYDDRGALVRASTQAGAHVRATVAPRGFTVISR